MPRSLWTGSLSFGLVNVPVQLVTAVRDQSFHFRQLNKKTHTPIEVRRFCSAEDVEVEYSEVAHGYELDDGKLVVVTDEDLETVEPRKTRTIDIGAFVPLEDVDPIHYAHPYVLLPVGDSEGTLRAYQLLVQVMEKTDRAALGRFVMRTKEYLVLVRARDERLALTTLLWHDEVRPRKEIAPSGKADKAAVEQTVAVIEQLTVDWKPERYEDRYRERLAEVIEKKRKGGTVKAPTVEKEPAPTPDLMAALEEMLAQGSSKSSKSSSSGSRSKSGGSKSTSGGSKSKSSGSKSKGKSKAKSKS